MTKLLLCANSYLLVTPSGGDNNAINVVAHAFSCPVNFLENYRICIILTTVTLLLASWSPLCPELGLPLLAASGI
ncbi:unnamed protein product [Microthlaspi erraticum]|uniref:Uncharacterized protein n=1 Tax=Microthlaspi erraticum TaxID=1685480 RepID=A0A6D2IR81_9BRAS|nr:unnamed protein product [Microthlaspi erraticum]